LSTVEFERPPDRRRRAVIRAFVPETSRVALPQSRGRSRCPELDCLRGKLPPGLLATAEQRAIELNIGADRVLIASGHLSEDEYVRALAGWLQVPFERLDVPRAACPLPDDRLIEAAKAGLLPLCVGGTFVYVVAPQILGARHLVAGAHPLPKDRFRLTSPQRLQRFALDHGAAALGERASEALRQERPEFSAAQCPPRIRTAWLGGIAIAASAATLFHDTAGALVSAALALIFLAWAALRVIGAATRWRAWRPLRVATSDLPIYTIVVALYDEARAVPGLVAALRKLAYPVEKLQIIFVLEPNDIPTRQALLQSNLGGPFEILIAPDFGPRTKPKALNAALALARGTFTAVFDAEDRPARDQLYRALDAFLGDGPYVACVQARLTIDNTADGWLARGIMAQTPPLSDRLAAFPMG
jgi:glycosyltransferase XagB